MQFDQSKEIPDDEVLSIIREIIKNGTLILSRHAKARMAERGYVLHDVIHILLNGEIIKREYRNRSENWAYEIQGCDLEGDQGAAVVAILKWMSAIVITVLG